MSISITPFPLELWTATIDSSRVGVTFVYPFHSVFFSTVFIVMSVCFLLFFSLRVHSRLVLFAQPVTGKSATLALMRLLVGVLSSWQYLCGIYNAF
jgi:hypothetical protein